MRNKSIAWIVVILLLISSSYAIDPLLLTADATSAWLLNMTNNETKNITSTSAIIDQLGDNDAQLMGTRTFYRLNGTYTPRKDDCYNGGCFALDGVNNGIEFSGIVTYNYGGVSYSFAAKKINDGRVQSIYGHRGFDTIQYLQFNAAGTAIEYEISNGNICSGTVTDTANWHHYALITNGTNCQIYQDGVAISMVDSTLSDDKIIINRIGKSQTYHFNGTLDEVLFINRTITPKEVEQIYNNSGVPERGDKMFLYLDMNKNSTVLAVDNNHLVQGRYTGDRALYLYDDNTEYVETDNQINIDENQSFTISLWSKWDRYDYSNKNYLLYIASTFYLKKYEVENTRRYLFYMRDHDQNACFKLYEFPTSIDPHDWINTVIRYDDDLKLWQVYVNGNYVNGNTCDGIEGSGVNTLRLSSSTNRWKGGITDVRTYNRSVETWTIEALNYSGHGVNYGIINITANDTNSSAIITTFNITAIDQDGAIYTAETTTERIIKTLPTGNYTVVIESDEYATINTTIELNIDESVEHNFELIRLDEMEIRVLNLSDSSIFSQNVTLKIQNATSQRTITIENGHGFITGLNYGKAYTLVFSSSGFQDNIYNINYIRDLNLNVYTAYLNPNSTTEIEYFVTDNNNIPIEGALIVIEGYVDDELTQIASRSTDVTGSGIFYLDTTQSIIITISKDGYTTTSHELNSPLAETVTFKLTSDIQIDFGDKLSGIAWDHTPKTVELTPNMTNFSFIISTNGVNLSNYNMTLSNDTGILAYNSSTSINGGNLKILYNLTDYINQTIYLKISFRKDGYIGYSEYYSYIIVSVDNDMGSFRATRQWFLDNTMTATRVKFWLLLFVVGVLIIASASFKLFGDPLKGVVLLIPYTIITGYIVAISYAVLGFIGAIMLMGIIFGKGLGDSR